MQGTLYAVRRSSGAYLDRVEDKGPVWTEKLQHAKMFPQIYKAESLAAVVPYTYDCDIVAVCVKELGTVDPGRMTQEARAKRDNEVAEARIVALAERIKELQRNLRNMLTEYYRCKTN